MIFTHTAGSTDYVSANYIIRRASKREWLVMCAHTDATLSIHDSYRAAKASLVAAPAAPAAPVAEPATEAAPAPTADAELADAIGEVNAAWSLLMLADDREPSTLVGPSTDAPTAIDRVAGVIPALGVWPPTPLRGRMVGVAAAIIGVLVADPAAFRPLAHALSLLALRVKQLAQATGHATPPAPTPDKAVCVGMWLCSDPGPAPEHALHHPDVGDLRLIWLRGKRWQLWSDEAKPRRQMYVDLPDGAELLALVAMLEGVATDP